MAAGRSPLVDGRPTCRESASSPRHFRHDNFITDRSDPIMPRRCALSPSHFGFRHGGDWTGVDVSGTVPEATANSRSFCGGAPGDEESGTTLNRTGSGQPNTSWAASWMDRVKCVPIHSLMNH